MAGSAAGSDERTRGAAWTPEQKGDVITVLDSNGCSCSASGRLVSTDVDVLLLIVVLVRIGVRVLERMLGLLGRVVVLSCCVPP